MLIRSESNRHGLARSELERVGHEVINDLLHCEWVKQAADIGLDVMFERAILMGRLGFIPMNNREHEMGKVGVGRLQLDVSGLKAAD